MKHYTQITKPTQEPVTLADIGNFGRNTGSPEETAVFSEMIRVARGFAEDFTGRALISSGWRMVSDSFDDLTLDRSPLVSVQSVKYYAEGETELTTLAAGTDYIVITGTTPGSVQLLIDPPVLADRPDAVQIEFTAGNSTPADIHPPLVHAVRIIAQHYRDNVGKNGTYDPTDIPVGARHLLESQRVGGWVG